jgi:hypothetical protein
MQLSTSLSRVCLLTLGLLFACEPETVATAPRCAEGSSVTCACPGGQTGAQHCTKEGAYGACECSPAAPIQAAQAVEAQAVEAQPAAAPTVERAPAASEGGAQIADAELTLTPEPGVYEVTISREGQCLSLSGPRKLPATTRKQRWKISVSSPNTLKIDDGNRSHGATLTNGEYVFDRASEHGRALIRLQFAPDGVRGTGTASAVTHRGKNRRTAEDCSETLTITGSRA